ncbi:MAG: RecQ family ATP-dependent DNA helicase [Bacteroidales bacterium]|jgi:ATP-dependent DNA helicase RecQ|nr:RecQ family ATP-dependent DNA helicase [Bacteroidales bacterium]
MPTMTAEFTLRQQARAILKKYWGYDDFRPLQEDIVVNTASGKDALALLPTGGGKSICFQVPALMCHGLCLVVSPLIALMKDQIENLQRHGLQAEALYSGLSTNEQNNILDRAADGSLKFLYVSPERLRSKDFLTRLMRIKVGLLAIDEAHCVSQWGYDFRPPYLQIAEIRPLIGKDVPLLALTATATPTVVKDIIERLQIKPATVFRKSFERSNLTYYVIHDEDKQGRLLRVVRKVKGCGIVYVRNRRRTEETAAFLKQNGFFAEAYHAGLAASTRSSRQTSWLENKIQIIVATNAFGMGIDKPDVRFVVHIDLPDTLEAYFQEAGRAGRDGKRSFALLIYHPSDKRNLEEKFSISYPSQEFLYNVYNALCNYYQIPVGSGENAVKQFSLQEFCASYRFRAPEAISALGFLARSGFILMSENIRSRSKISIPVSHEALYRFSIDIPRYGNVIQTILRLYGGKVFSWYADISESDIAAKSGLPKDAVIEHLKFLQKRNIINYEQIEKGATVTFTQPRVEIEKDLLLPKLLRQQTKNALNKLQQSIDYAASEHLCRSIQLLRYFGEENAGKCGVCDVCLAMQESVLTDKEYKEMLRDVLPEIKEKGINIRETADTFLQYSEKKIILFWRRALDEKLI